MLENETDTQSLNEEEVDTDLDELEIAESEVSDDTVDKSEELVKAEELAENYKKRAEKAEGKLKDKPKAVETKAPKKEQEQQALTREETILFAKNVLDTDEDLEDAKFIAERKGIGLAEAVDTLTFKSLKRERDNEKKAEDSSLRASRGSKVKEKITLKSKGLSTDDHKRLAAAKLG